MLAGPRTAHAGGGRRARKENPRRVRTDLDADIELLATAPGGGLYEDRDFRMAWRGVLYVPGECRGLPSIEAFAHHLRRESWPAALGRLRGAYALLVLDRRRGELWGLVDESAGLPLHLTPRGFAPDLLSAAARLPDPVAAFTRERLWNWLAYGLPLAGDSPFDGVRTLIGSECARRDRAGEVQILPRPESVPREELQPLLRREFAALARALAHDRVSVDLTGGLDSRLVAAMLRHQGLDFEAALIGPEDGPEVVIAREVAGRLGVPLHVTPHRLDDLPRTLPELLRITGGEPNPVSYHPDAQLHRQRRARGCTIVVGGAGGAHLRDLYFAHEFPFLAGRHCPLRRLWRLKFYAVPLRREYLVGTEAVEELLWARFCQHARPHLRASKTASIQNILARLKGGKATALLHAGTLALGLPLAEPLQERVLIAAAMSTSPWRRLLHYEMRRALMAHAPELAAIPTVTGFSCLPTPRHLARDALRQLHFHLQRGWHKLQQRCFGRSRLATAAHVLAFHPDYEAAVARSGLLERALGTLAAAGLVPSGLAPEQIFPHHRNLFIHAGLLLEAVQQRR